MNERNNVKRVKEKTPKREKKKTLRLETKKHMSQVTRSKRSHIEFVKTASKRNNLIILLFHLSFPFFPFYFNSISIFRVFFFFIFGTRTLITCAGDGKFIFSTKIECYVSCCCCYYFNVGAFVRLVSQMWFAYKAF